MAVEECEWDPFTDFLQWTASIDSSTINCCTLRSVANLWVAPSHCLGTAVTTEKTISALHGPAYSGSPRCPGWDFLRATQQCEPPRPHLSYSPYFLFSYVKSASRSKTSLYPLLLSPFPWPGISPNKSRTYLNLSWHLLLGHKKHTNSKCWNL